MHFSSCGFIPSNRVSPVSNKTEADKRVSATKSLLLEMENHLSMIRRSDGIFQSMYFSRSTENDPSVQSITNNDDVSTIFFRKQFTGHLRASVNSSEILSIKSNF